MRSASSASRHQQIWQAVCCTEGGDVHTVTLACSPAFGHGSWHASAQVRRQVPCTECFAASAVQCPVTEMAASGALFVGVCSVRTCILCQDKLLDVQHVWRYLTGRRCEESIHHCNLFADFSRALNSSKFRHVRAVELSATHRPHTWQPAFGVTTGTA